MGLAGLRVGHLTRYRRGDPVGYAFLFCRLLSYHFGVYLQVWWQVAAVAELTAVAIRSVFARGAVCAKDFFIVHSPFDADYGVAMAPRMGALRWKLKERLPGNIAGIFLFSMNYVDGCAQRSEIFSGSEKLSLRCVLYVLEEIVGVPPREWRDPLSMCDLKLRLL